eukprot:1769511-Amphidinium_carterae.1
MARAGGKRSSVLPAILSAAGHSEASPCQFVLQNPLQQQVLPSCWYPGSTLHRRLPSFGGLQVYLLLDPPWFAMPSWMSSRSGGSP